MYQNKKIKTICVIVFVLVFFFFSKDLYAMTQKQIGEVIATFAINFQKSPKGGGLCTYDTRGGNTLYAERSGTYNGTPNSEGLFRLECVGWVSMCIHLSTGLDHPGVSSGYNGFIMPTSCYNHNSTTDYFERVQGALQPGDILVNSHHVMVYVGKINGEDRIVHSAGTPLYNNTFEEYAASNYDKSDNPIRGVYTEAYRIKSEYAKKINKKDTRTTWSGSNGAIDWDKNDGTSSNKISWSDYLVKQAKKCHDFVRDRGMIYGGSSIPLTGSTVDCSAYVSYVLYECGFEDMAGDQHTTYNYSFGAYGKEKGWERIENYNDLKPRRYMLF